MKMTYRTHKNAEAVARFWGKSLDRPDWYAVKAQSDDEAEIMIYDVIGWPYNDATELVRSINGIKSKSILVRINSPGGDVFDGVAIFNALKNHDSKVVTRVEGIAASMASILAVAGKEAQAYSNTMLMIHNAWTYAAGDQNDFRELAALLEKIDENLLGIYTGKTRTGKKEMRQMMAEETWMNADEARSKGFIDTIIESGKAAKAQFDLSMFAKVPDDLGGVIKEHTEREREKALRDVGFSQHEAKVILAGRWKPNGDDETIAACNNVIKLMKGGY